MNSLYSIYKSEVESKFKKFNSSSSRKFNIDNYSVYEVIMRSGREAIKFELSSIEELTEFAVLFLKESFVRREGLFNEYRTNK